MIPGSWTPGFPGVLSPARDMAGEMLGRGAMGGLALKLVSVAACLLLFLGSFAVDGKASTEAHPHQGKVKVSG